METAVGIVLPSGGYLSIMPKIDFERLKAYSREAISELDEAIKRNIRREADQKARELEEKLAKKKKKKRRKLQQQNNQ